jgi:multidrug efflux pump subunit AcrB/multidrug efflux pump subunit AcrA (membrane-fusion protein)
VDRTVGGYRAPGRQVDARGVGIAPAVYGGKLRRILAYVERDKLEARGLSPMDAVQALPRQSVFIPAGNIKAGDFDFQIFANAMPPRVEQLNDIPISVQNGAPVLLRDVGQAKDSAQIQTNVVRLREFDPKARELTLEVVLDQSVYVRESLRGLQHAGVAGAILAAAVVFLFLRNLRSTLIVVVSIPLSILAVLIGLYYSGDTLNAMTLGGLALAIGILVDQGIVVVENIVRHVQTGKSPLEAARVGASEVVLPVLVSTIAFVVVFYPVVFLSGMAKSIFTPLALAATFAILASYVISMTLIPAYAARFLKPAAGGHQEASRGGLTERYAALVETAISHRRAVLVGSGLLLAAAVYLLSRTGTELFPQVDAGQFQILVRLPSGTRIEKTEETVAQVERILVDKIGVPDPEYPRREGHPDSNLRMLISNIGVLMDWPAAYTPNTGPMDAFVLVQLKKKPGQPGAFQYVARLRAKLRQALPGVEFSFDTGGMLTAALNMGEPDPIHVQVAGSSLETSHQIARAVAGEAARVPGAADVRIAQRLDYPILDLQIDRLKAAYAGVDVDDIMRNLVTATNSSINFQPAFWIDEQNGNHYFIGAQYPEAHLTSLETLRDIPVRGARAAETVPLRNLVRIERKVGPSVVNHYNITRVIDVYAAVLPGYDVGSVVSAIEARLEASKELGLVPRQSDRGPYYEVAGSEFAGKGYSINLSGEVATMRDAFRQFAFGLVIAVILVHLVMVAQLRSFLDPFVISLAVPLGFVGVGVVLYGTGTALNIQSLMGFIMMVGIVVQFSVILVDFANRRLAEGKRRLPGNRGCRSCAASPHSDDGSRHLAGYAADGGGIRRRRGQRASGPGDRRGRSGRGRPYALRGSVSLCQRQGSSEGDSKVSEVRKTRRFGNGAALAVVLLAYGCSTPRTESASPGDSTADAARPVQVTRPLRQDLTLTFRLPGSVEAFEQTTLYAKAAGYLKSIHVDKGDRVRKGQVLAELEIPEMAREEEETKARLAEARANAELEKARAAVAVAEAGQALVRAMMEYGVIRAPFSGVVTERFVRRSHPDGGVDAPGHPVVTVMNMSVVRVYVYVPESAVPHVRKGTPAVLEVDALPVRGFEAGVARFASALDPATRTMKVELNIPNRPTPEGVLLHGMYAQVTLRLDLGRQSLTLPAESLIQEAERRYVLCVEDGRLAKREVRRGVETEGLVEILSGLTGEERVVVGDTSGLSEGMRVSEQERGRGGKPE